MGSRRRIRRLSSRSRSIRRSLNRPIRPSSSPRIRKRTRDTRSRGHGEAPAAPEEAYGSPDNGEQGYPQPQYAPQQPLSPGQLEQLVAPIALYPDGLVAQVLAASTYPLQITDAARWRQAQSDAAPEQIAAEADGQNWDPSVKALTAFPQVLAQMADNLSWTTELGNAYYNQPQDVLTAVQTMRQRAQSAGNLQNTPQETVTDNQGYVQVEPANPEVVYVPTYDPWAVYGAPVAPYPGYSVLNAIGDVVSVAALGAAVYFGVGMVMSAFARMTWGFFGWGCNWFGDALMFHGGYYSPHSWTVRDWGLAHGGPRYFGRFAGSRGFGGRYEARGGYGGARNGYAARGFAGNRTAEGYRGGYGRNLQAESRMPAFNARGNYGRTGGYASNGNLVRSARGNAWSGAARSGNVGRYSSPAYGRSEGFANRMVASGDRYGSSYGPGFYGRSGSSYGYRGETAGRAGAPGYGRSGRQAGFGGSFRGTSPSYRASTNGFRGSEFGGSSFGARSSRSFGGFSRSSSRGAFGGGHAARSFGGGGHFSGGSHFGGGGHFSGGHSGGHGGGHRR